MPYGYLLVTMNVSDPERYKQYMAEAPTAVKAFGGEYLVRGGKHETLEGEWNPSISGKDVALNVKVDPSIIGGLVVKLGSRMVDSSLRTKLNSIKHAMKEAG